MLKKRIFLDTNVCIDIASHKLDQEWSSIRRYVLQDYKYVISPLTFLEVLIRIGRGDQRYFERNRKALQVLVGTKKNKPFLEFPAHFLLKHVVDNTTPAKIQPRDFEQWTQLVLKAQDKTKLELGAIKSSYPRRTYGLDFSLVDQQLQDGKDYHRHMLEGVRVGSKVYTSALLWTAGLLEGMSIKPYKKICEKVSKALEAAYCFDEYLWKQAKNPQYDFRKHDSDWIDGQQLFYLCDENVWFVTQDKNILQETKKSLQNTRIIPFQKLRELAAVKCKLV